jgi:hypothetical protein
VIFCDQQRFEGQSFSSEIFMPGIGTCVTAIGVMMILAGHFWIVVAAFRKSFLWGATSLLVPVIVVAFVFAHWGRVAKPFGLYVAGWLIMLVGAAITGSAYS